VAHQLAVAAAYCAAVALLCSSGAVEYFPTDVALGIGALLALVALHFPLGYMVRRRWSYPMCAFPAVWAVITRGGVFIGEITDYGSALAAMWVVLGLPFALVLVAVARRLRPKL